MTSRPSLQLAAAAVLLVVAACDGSYEVGRMNSRESVVSSGGTDSPTSEPQSQNQAGAPDSDPLSTCEPGKPPPALTGPFAEPQVVWDRIAAVLSPQPLEPPSPLPATTTYAWAGDIVAQAFSQATDDGLPAPGANDFVQRFLRLPAGAAPLSVDWGRQLLSNMPTMEVLLLTQLGDDARRIGIFTEPVWLEQFPQIATRGYIFASSALGLEMPPEDDDFTMRENPDPGPLTSRRQAQAAAVANASCAACHSLIDPLGFSLEHFDGLGNYQDMDGSKPVNTGGTYRVPGTTRDIVFDDNVNLSQQLQYVCAANLGTASNYLNLALARSHVAADDRRAAHDQNLTRFQQAYVGNGRSYRALITAWAQSPIVLYP